MTVNDISRDEVRRTLRDIDREHDEATEVDVLRFARDLETIAAQKKTRGDIGASKDICDRHRPRERCSVSV